MEFDRRPIAVTAFEVLNIASVAFEVITNRSIESWIFMGLWVALTLWITRGRSNPGRIVYTIITVFGTAVTVAGIGLGYAAGASFLSLAAFVFFFVLFLGLLWLPSTSAWLKGRRRSATAKPERPTSTHSCR